jgi:hypothetical protein
VGAGVSTSPAPRKVGKLAIRWHVPGVLPKGAPNLFIGNSGSGKTRFSIPILDALTDGRPVFGKPTKPTKIFYVMCDRPSQYARDTWEALGFDPSKIPMFSFMDQEIDWSFKYVIDKIPEGTELVFIEALAMLIPEPQGKEPLYKAALGFIRKLNLYTQRTGIDFWASTHSPKMKSGETQSSSRNSGIGSVGLPAGCGTIIEFIETGPSGERLIRFNIHSGPAYESDYCFNAEGHLVEVQQTIGQVILDVWLAKLAPGLTFTTADAIEYGMSKGLKAERTIYNWLSASVGDGLLDKIGRGQYRKRAKV